MLAHPRNKSLGVVAIILAGLGIFVGIEELLAAATTGMGWDHGSGGTSALQEKAKDGVLLVGGVLLVMSIVLLVVGILLVNGRGLMLAKVWGVFGVVIAIGLVLDAVSNQELVDELGESGRYPYPGYLVDLGTGRIFALGALVLLPIAMLVGPRRPPLDDALR